MNGFSSVVGALLAVSTMLNAHADPNITASATATPNGGFDRMTWDITPEVVPTNVNASYYWANQLSSEHGGHAIYTGIQPRTQGSNLVIFSAFGTGTTPLSTNCRGGADGGAGTSCSLAYAWKPGHAYRLQVVHAQADRNDGRSTVEGFITDVATGVTTPTGSISVPADWGGLSSSAYLFDEYFPFNGASSDPMKRSCVPYARYTTSLPHFYLKDVDYPTTERSIRLNTGKDKCAVLAGTPNARATLVNTSTYRLENGFLPGSPGAPK
ncbi:DUF3472 domain-containing protein [Burkholderia lata]|uniref:F0F1 ATP synthase n=1 Tax=Burkholderia lata (strain ATCC 17760 / DSM 23089 / LMG 22485 / NCIMB 9086 / R18194 / 383) TaxID=482957 RepID=A0A6P2HEZ5_BURL3|nr:F0F1 ATP synthase [Burkholderia lata]